jgi:hypothetical protein
MSQIRAERQVTIESAVVRVTCDNCGKTHNVTPPERHSFTPEGWVSFDSSHSDWGSDSGESYDTHDACSWKCYRAIVKKLVDDYARHEPAHPTLLVDDRDYSFLRDMVSDE